MENRWKEEDWMANGKVAMVVWLVLGFIGELKISCSFLSVEVMRKMPTIPFIWGTQGRSKLSQSYSKPTSRGRVVSVEV